MMTQWISINDKKPPENVNVIFLLEIISLGNECIKEFTTSSQQHIMGIGKICLDNDENILRYVIFTMTDYPVQYPYIQKFIPYPPIAFPITQNDFKEVDEKDILVCHLKLIAWIRLSRNFVDYTIEKHLNIPHRSQMLDLD